jgi:hypothetical protein
MQARSPNHRVHVKAVSITYSECVFVAFGIQHAMRMCHIFICGLTGYTVFFHVQKRHDYREKIEQKNLF